MIRAHAAAVKNIRTAAARHSADLICYMLSLIGLFYTLGLEGKND